MLLTFIFLIVLVLFTITFIGFINWRGLMGLKLKVKGECVENVMKASSSGASILNHAIKNEMANIMLSMHNLQHKIGDPNKNIQIVSNSLSHFQEITDRITLFTREVVLSTDDHNLGVIINDSLNSVASAIQEKQIQVLKNIPPALIISCDQVHLQRALDNLLKNALEAMNLMGKLEIDLKQEGCFVVITIKDDGEGISEKNLPLIFIPFFTTRKFGNNYGLGLSYCYQVVQKHGGKIEIKSETEKGTRVSIYFPASRTKIPA